MSDKRKLLLPKLPSRDLVKGRIFVADGSVVHGRVVREIIA